MSSAPHPDRVPNRLLDETSPYLLQHAYNPVDWRPWGDEAFAAARSEDKPVFLSVGYSACHWCHVMERESFENDAIAAILNSRFISIKVDREERPDVDQIYMSAVQALTQRGGWPMSVFLTPDRQPFFGGTYWPPTSRMGMRGFKEILELIADAWQNRRDDITRSAASLTSAVQQMASASFEPAALSVDTLRHTMQSLLAVVDRREGGFGGAPKFPHPMDLRLLLRCASRFDNSDALHCARLTLDKMAAGGIYDQLGGGFHRYSTDGRWLAPHFEKMLYDNALLVPAYLDAWHMTANPEDERIVRETLDYVLREMTAPDGGFYSTQDADSEGEEGRFFVWSQAEVEQLLGREEAALFAAAYDVTPSGNWEGHSILNRPRPFSEVADRLGLSLEQLQERLAKSRSELLAARNLRVAPGRDDKILTAWNGLMIAAMAYAGRSLNEPRYTAAASAAARFILSSLRTETGELLHSFKDGRARFQAYLDDFACLIDGLVELHQADGDLHWLTEAAALADTMIDNFQDDEAGGFYYTARNHEQLITRIKDSQDNATPSGNGMAATALLRLATITGHSRFHDVAIRTLESLSGLLEEHPRAAGQSLLALDFLLSPPRVVVIIGENNIETTALEQAARSRHDAALLTVAIADPATIPPVLQPQAGGKSSINGKATAYVCEMGTCQPPCHSPEELARQLQALKN